MNSRRTAAASLAGAAAATLMIALPSTPASAHGTLSNPPSRVYTCKEEGPETPESGACKAAVAAGGTQPFYDWNEVSLLDAGGRHQEVVPDGKLCSAGRAKYRGLDLPRADWPATSVAPGPLTVTYHATAPHANSNFEFYVTRDGWRPDQPLRWADLVPLESFENQNPTTFTDWTVTLPQRSGRHILYSIWQRVQGSAEAFYTCSDVDFGGGTNTPAPEPEPEVPVEPEQPETPQPEEPQEPQQPEQPEQPGGSWAAGTTYRVGDQVTFDGVTYQCRQAHTTITGWEPPVVPALWLPV
ncbi:lytic polysaccharide monooxygenase [Saccharothrix sp. AJ9571]|nr:lytic polysaccharide monooxygenase [Saccharothrix sp. AJ9571]